MTDMKPYSLKFINDAFHASRDTAARIVEELVEAWTPDRKTRITRAMQDKGAELVDHVLSRYFLIGRWDEHPNAGFFLLPDVE